MGRIHDSPIGIFDANWWIGWALVDDMGRGGAEMSSATTVGNDGCRNQWWFTAGDGGTYTGNGQQTRSNW